MTSLLIFSFWTRRRQDSTISPVRPSIQVLQVAGCACRGFPILARSVRKGLRVARSLRLDRKGRCERNQIFRVPSAPTLSPCPLVQPENVGIDSARMRIAFVAEYLAEYLAA